MIRVKDLFDKCMGTDLELNRQEQLPPSHPEAVRYVSRTEKNNGVTTYIRRIAKEPSPAHVLSVACGGSVLSTFYQDQPFYSGRDLYYLRPKVDLTPKEMLFYALIIKQNKYKYNYGRQANRTLAELEIPAPDEIPSWVYEMEIPTFDDISEAKTIEKVELPPVSEWKGFKYSEIFNMTRGQGGTATEAKKNPGTNYYVGASDENNGITQYTSLNTTEPANRITVANNGSVGAAFYQSAPFLASSDVTVLSIKERELTPAIAMFLITLIRQEAAKINYGRKWGISRMKESIIYLPVTKSGAPNWRLMEDYINSLPYSKYL